MIALMHGFRVQGNILADLEMFPLLCILQSIWVPLTEHGEADGLGDGAAHPVAGLAAVEPRLVVRYVGHRVHPHTRILQYFVLNEGQAIQAFNSLSKLYYMFPLLKSKTMSLLYLLMDA